MFHDIYCLFNWYVCKQVFYVKGNSFVVKLNKYHKCKNKNKLHKNITSFTICQPTTNMHVQTDLTATRNTDHSSSYTTMCTTSTHNHFNVACISSPLCYIIILCIPQLYHYRDYIIAFIYRPVHSCCRTTHTQKILGQPESTPPIFNNIENYTNVKLHTDGGQQTTIPTTKHKSVNNDL
jgi:hypothetical protein